MSFEDVMMKRLAACHAEACKEILAGVKSGRSLSDAVTDTIEALPPSKTRDLRRWLEDWEAWEEWQKWKAKGWRIQKSGPTVLLIQSLNKYVDQVGREIIQRWPSDAAVAAAAGVPRVKFGKVFGRRKENGKWVVFMPTAGFESGPGDVVTEFWVMR